MTVSLVRRLADSFHLVASPLELSATPHQYRRAPELLGEHTDEVLASFGVDTAERASLCAQGAIA